MSTTKGRYTVTLSFLDLLQSVLGHILQWSLHAQKVQEVNPQDFLRCLRYVRSDVLSSYYSWKYLRVSERWQMGIQILSILRQVQFFCLFICSSVCLFVSPKVLTDVRPVRPAPGVDSLQQSVRDSLSADASFHHVLLSVAGLNEFVCCSL